MKKPYTNNLLDADHAVEDYLSTLLHDDKKNTPMESAIAENLPPVILPDIGLESVTESITAEEGRFIDDTDTLVADSNPLNTEKNELSHSIPHNESAIDKSSDYDFPMQCLMFKVNDVQLALPLMELESVQPWIDKLTRLPRSPNWCVGVFNYRNQNISVADTAKLLNINTQSTHDSGKHILVLANLGWGISCDQLGSVINIHQEDVKWAQTDKQSLALGVLKSSLAQLLDPSEIGQYLNCDGAETKK